MTPIGVSARQQQLFLSQHATIPSGYAALAGRAITKQPALHSLDIRAKTCLLQVNRRVRSSNHRPCFLLSFFFFFHDFLGAPEMKYQRQETVLNLAAL